MIGIMKVLVLISALALVVNSQYYYSADEWSEIYNCENNVFTSLVKITKYCQHTNYIRPLSSVRKEWDVVSGEVLTNMLNTYCRSIDDVDTCVETELLIASCLEDEKENYQTMMLKSNWLCRSEVKEALSRKLSSLPNVSLQPNNKCVRESAKLTYQCVSHYVKNKPPTPIRMWNRIIASLPCSFRKLKKVCPTGEALLLAVLNYDWLVLPPALGVNVSQILMKLKIKT